MILPTMNLEEVRKEIEKDFPILIRKMNYVCYDLEKKFRKEIKQHDLIRFFDYHSKYKNYWIYRVEITRTTMLNAAMLLYHNGKGYAGITATQDMNIIYHTGHFFSRYNERRNLGLNSITDIIRVYLNENTQFRFNELEEIEPGIFKMFCIIPTGVVLGISHRRLRMIKANTFLTNEMLNKSQAEIWTQLKFILEKYKFTSLGLE